MVRVEDLENLPLKVFLNQEQKVAVEYKFNLLEFHDYLGIGYDVANQAYHNRYLTGKIDYIRFRNEN